MPDAQTMSKVDHANIHCLSYRPDMRHGAGDTRTLKRTIVIVAPSGDIVLFIGGVLILIAAGLDWRR